MPRVGRPRTKTGKAATAHRTASQKEYANLPASGKKARVADRSKEAQRKADNKRASTASPARKAYRAKEATSLAKAKKTAPPKPATCQWPGCNRTDIQLHHQGKDMWLCPTHHGARRTQMMKGKG